MQDGSAMHGWPKLLMGWTHTRGKWLQGCGRYDNDGDNDGRKKRANGVNPTRAALFIGGLPYLLVASPSAVRHILQRLYPDNFARR
jgi:hypothetical protein